jgi:uncharacterized protein YjiS (DUF1127 family)
MRTLTNHPLWGTVDQAMFSARLSISRRPVMAGFAYPSLTNSQLSTLPAQSRTGRRSGLLSRLAANLRLWRRRIDERAALAKLSQRELADFGATTADVYRELSTPFWRAQPPC